MPVIFWFGDCLALVELEESSFAKNVLDSKGNSVVFFYAAWCPDCRKAEPMLEEVSMQFEGVRFFKLDAEKFEGIADQYWVEKYPTIVVMKSGRPLADSLVEPGSTAEIHSWLSKRL